MRINSKRTTFASFAENPDHRGQADEKLITDGVLSESIGDSRQKDYLRLN